MSDILSKVKDLFADFLAIEGDSIKPESTIKDDLGVDSVDIVSIVSELENAFDLKISDAEAANLKTVGQVVELISARVA
ncbi:acyl carrier protein [Ammoniphilus oxalaticus]|uniref:Acyl carrier protein n=1 Tax=Ammoniphilus oxalaticus TaxID=66863 RepID=A0A419SG07_9BACL|nr:acyl carrier protein [Ammoniphilus oxalaticus]RKD22718.1 acyl carrier protein [Ammoniphilus oxalaticus]